MNSSLKPIHLHSHASGPNPWKVQIVLEELGLPFEVEYMDMGALKQPPFEKLNPNGRVPVIVDPNTGITLWESAAIIEYLIENYDKTNTLTYTTSPEKYYVKQWLYFQMSGQGPYFGQAMWFSKFHSEQIPSAIKRYEDQVLRVVYVLDKALQGKEYLVGDKCTVADLSFMTWDASIPFIFGDKYADLEIEKNYPAYSAWKARVSSRPAVQKTMKTKMEAMASAHKH